MSHGEAKTLYLDVAAADVRLDGNALRVTASEQAARFVPLNRVARAVVRGGGHGLLAACLEIVARGGMVHFETEGGRLAAVLQNTNPAESETARELAMVIESHDGLGPFHWWQDAQRRHAWSLVFQRGIRGDFQSAQRKFELYLGFFTPGVPVHRELKRLDAKLHAWLQAELNRQGLQPVVHALAEKGADLVTTLRQCLSLTNSWAYARWRRQQPENLSEQELARFLELRTAAPLPEQLQRHLRALASEYHTSWNRINAESEDE